MCSSSCISFAAENEYWTDEGIFMSLLDFKSGIPFPSNITTDINPYQYKPSDLPADLWYYCCGVKKYGECGLWLKTGEACEIFSNSDFRGLRTTLQFYEGRDPHVKKTDWVMQEYRITGKCNSSSKFLADYGALCRVFLASVNRPHSRVSVANIDVKISINLDKETGPGPSLVTKRSQDPFIENVSEMDCILKGDYFELNDLVDPISRSSSSANSSCLSMTSDEYFDSMALLRDLEDDINDQKMKHKNVKFNISAPVLSKEIVIHPATLVSLINDEDGKLSAKDTSKMDNKSIINSVNATSSSSSSSSSYKNKSKEEKKECVSRAKRRKMIKYLCFLAL